MPYFNSCRQKSEVGQTGLKVPRTEDIMHLAVVACGNRLEETLNMVKSALLFSIKKIKFHIFAEEELKGQFEKEVRVQLDLSLSHDHSFPYQVNTVVAFF